MYFFEFSRIAYINNNCVTNVKEQMLYYYYYMKYHYI